MGILATILKKRLTSEIILIGASKFVITFQTHDINCVTPVGISEKGTVSSQHLTWFFRLSQIFNQIGKSRKLKKSQLSAPLKTAGRKMQFFRNNNRCGSVHHYLLQIQLMNPIKWLFQYTLCN